ncbi:hypothetical protein A2763_03810 [Candidatus Kaiserbacteria bacterium RIFCSPHIGHO2_01_FULL_54_36]|uniref:DUF924 domain-containing protein n=1 Tax=Candidatus Kaiserbacteria bacterium RIFCSPHIGHO2_01_FULL_54_36 TaxID=1798482 RepID=A0A1F6CJI4_9BACT|nr:MAG: hypothetical protein A2763_03810 [Candidatus Kaiserbacteria bacterium RIFCSPHIGHO2_01_FULL_54_36]OGG75607.1 MAG: hypothetical protein A3A41_00620 [Candidatus Kaiserbacteria bacterium RIFCSPLOWO2_01_FULL_54_22]
MSWRPFIKFWFKECGPDQWFFKKRKAFDRLLRKRFLSLYGEVVRGEHADWRKSPKGRLAEIIIVDQLSRNMFRGTPAMFAYDALALALAQEAVRARADKRLTKWERVFMYLPFMHSESKKIQRESLRLFKSIGDKQNTWYARDHKRIVDRFGRYPHRNYILGRKSTPAEKKFMQTHKGY